MRDLEQLGDEGFILQRRFLSELCKLRKLPDSNCPDPQAGLGALRLLKELALKHDLMRKKESADLKGRVQDAHSRADQIRKRAAGLEQLLKIFYENAASEDRQASGYSLEDLLKELFSIYEVESFRKSYRGEGEQIDGSFSFRGFDYIVEARWRKDVPSLDALLAFRGKVERKIKSTRGFFVSIPGFRDDTLQRFKEGGPANTIFMSGEDLTLILEGRVNLQDALQAKADKAFQEGVLYYPLKLLLSGK